MTAKTRWAILGTGAICRDFTAALAVSEFGMLHAIGSSDPSRAARFAETHGAAHSGTYADILARDDVDAVYVGTVHTTHVELTLAALRAGKAVLCEKPMALSAAETQRVIEAARKAGLPFVEAYKFRFGPFFKTLTALLAEGEIGDVCALDASFGFRAGSRTGRLFDPALAGGALYDVGGYPLAFATGMASAVGIALETATVDSAGARMTHGVDGTIHARLRTGDFTAAVHASIITPRTRTVRIRGSKGTIVLPNGWGSRAASASVIQLRRHGRLQRSIETPTVNPMAGEADSLSHALAEGRCETPEMPWSDSLVTNTLLERWGDHALGRREG
ncbi:Gfo/Idh/MocA family protein [Martelella mangrovi]|uniref:Dehydrogenase n=1 Tax=Martelella mangrovi TaxID=1397477 RepID=A0ABV2IDD6_9HYPH